MEEPRKLPDLNLPAPTNRSTERDPGSFGQESTSVPPMKVAKPHGDDPFDPAGFNAPKK